MRVSAIQMDMKLGEPEYNFAHAVELVRRAAATGADVITLPETWNVGFFPSENLEALSDREGERVKATFGPLAKELGVNIVAGSVSNVRDGQNPITPVIPSTVRARSLRITTRPTCSPRWGNTIPSSLEIVW